MFNSDRDGFLIPDAPLRTDELAQGIMGVRRNTDTIIGLLKGRAKAATLQRARVVVQGSARGATGSPLSAGEHPGAQARRGPSGGAMGSSADAGARVAGAARRGPSGGATDALPERDSRGRFVAKPIGDVAKAVRQLTRQQSQDMAENSRREAARENREGGSAAGGEQQRDARGRFGAGGGGPNDDKEGGDSKSLTLAILKAAAQGGAAALGSTEKVDPAIESAQEIHGMVSGAVSALKTTGKLGIAVAGRAFGSAKEKDVPWYRKLLQQLKLMRRDDGEFHRAELRALNNRAGGGGGGGGGGSALPDWVPKLPGAVPKLLGAGAKLLGKLALPAAAIGSAIKSFGTNTSDYADRLGTKDDGGIAKSLGIRAAGVLGDLGSTLTLGLADKLGKSETLGKVIEKSVSGLSAAKDWALGKTSQLFESGRKGAGTISTGKGDNGGVSYGTYQMSTTKGVAGDFVKGSKYAKDFEGLKPGTPEFSAKWKEVAAADPSFGQAQHDYIQKTKYEPQQQKLKDSGIDLSKRGAAVQDAIWSTSVQFGGNTSLIQGALKGRDAAKMSDAEIVTAIQDYKLKNNDALFKSSSPDVRASTAKRAQNEKVDLLKLAEGASPVAPPTGLGITSSPAPSIPLPTAGATVPASLAAPASIRPPPVSVAPAPPPAASPELHVPLTSKGPLEVTVRNDQLANQDVKDRRLAQIATGGVSGA